MMRPRVRAIEAARISKLAGTREQAIGLARRSDEVARYADAYGYDLVGIAEDTDVSGSTDPFARPKLGAWLARPGDFDLILANDLDRVGRNARHLTHLREWCEDTAHKLIILNPHLEWPPADGDMASPIIWDLLGRLAEYELKAITTRNRETRAWLQSHGALAVKAPFGYHAVGERASKTLEIHPVTGPIVREAADRYLAGETLAEIAEDFNRRGLPSRNEPVKKFDGPRWHRNNIGRILGSMKICGRLKQGDHILRYPAIITVAEHKAIVARLESRTHHRTVAKENREMLTSVLFCGYCRKGMYAINSGRPPARYRYYYCQNPKCPAKPRPMIPLMDANITALEAVTTLLKDAKVMRTEVIPGHDYEDDIDQLKLDLAALDPESPGWDEQVADIRAQIAHLRSLPVEPAREVRVPTGEYIADVFTDATDDERRGILMRSHISFVVTRKDSGGYNLKMEVS